VLTLGGGVNRPPNSPPGATAWYGVTLKQEGVDGQVNQFEGQFEGHTVETYIQG